MTNIIVGLLAIAFGLWGMTVWWWSVAELLRGLVPVILILVGAVALAAGMSAVRLGKEKKDQDLFEDGE